MKNVTTLPDGTTDIRTATKNVKTHALVGMHKGVWKVLSLHNNEKLAVAKKQDWEGSEGYSTWAWSNLTVLTVEQI